MVKRSNFRLSKSDTFDDPICHFFSFRVFLAECNLNFTAFLLRLLSLRRLHLCISCGIFCEFTSLSKLIFLIPTRVCAVAWACNVEQTLFFNAYAIDLKKIFSHGNFRKIIREKEEIKK